MLEDLIDIIFPASCLACGEKPKPICERCIPVFGAPVTEGNLYFASELNLELGAVLSALKDKNRTALLPVLARGLQPCLQLAIAELQPELLVCPPSSKAQYRKRGFNPALEIFSRANRSGLAITDRLLKFDRQPKDQRGLSKSERHLNTQNLFIAQRIGARVMLVDDVLTTGSTLMAATVALQQAGAKIVGSCVLARRLELFGHENENGRSLFRYQRLTGGK